MWECVCVITLRWSECSSQYCQNLRNIGEPLYIISCVFCMRQCLCVVLILNHKQNIPSIYGLEYVYMYICISVSMCRYTYISLALSLPTRLRESLIALFNWYASPHFYSQLPISLREPVSPLYAYLKILNPSFCSPLSPSISLLLFCSKFKTYLFSKSFPP